MVRPLFSPNLGLGPRAGGNRSLGESQTDFFFLAVQATADHIARVISSTAVRRLVDFNWEGPALTGRYPTLAVSNLRARSFDQVLEMLARLAQTGVVAPYPELAQYICHELGLPKPQEAVGSR